MSDGKIATNMLCLMSRTDYDQISSDKQESIRPFYDAFQDYVMSTRLVSNGNQTTIEIMAANGMVPELNKLLWYGIHDLVSPGNIAYIEIHNFNEEGNTIDIEKYIIDSVVMSIVKHPNGTEPQTIQITGGIMKEITIEDKSIEDVSGCADNCDSECTMDDCCAIEDVSGCADNCDSECTMDDCCE